MKKFFEPETVALIGASSRESTAGYQLFLNMRTCFGDRFYPVNPTTDKLDGTACFPSILDVPAEIDVAVVFIPARAVPEALEQCAERGIDRVVIESAGFSEAGPEERCCTQPMPRNREKRRDALWGPNCMGLINVRQTKVLSFLLNFLWKDRFKKGRVSLVVQSGMLSAGFLASILSRTPFGLSKIASIGNKMDVDESDVLEYLIEDPETGVIALYLESISNGRRFYEACRSTDKPIVVLKSGRTEEGARAARSHTASLAQDDRVVDGDAPPGRGDPGTRHERSDDDRPKSGSGSGRRKVGRTDRDHDVFRRRRGGRVRLHRRFGNRPGEARRLRASEGSGRCIRNGWSRRILSISTRPSRETGWRRSSRIASRPC